MDTEWSLKRASPLCCCQRCQRVFRPHRSAGRGLAETVVDRQEGTVINSLRLWYHLTRCLLSTPDCKRRGTAWLTAGTKRWRLGTITGDLRVITFALSNGLPFSPRRLRLAWLVFLVPCISFSSHGFGAGGQQTRALHWPHAQDGLFLNLRSALPMQIPRGSHLDRERGNSRFNEQTDTDPGISHRVAKP